MFFKAQKVDEKSRIEIVQNKATCQSLSEKKKKLPNLTLFQSNLFQFFAPS